MEPPAPGSPDYETLAAENAALRQQLGEVTAKLDAALTEIERLKRQGKRQANPFSKGTRKADPGTPGRKPGQGQFRHREAPTPEAVTGPPVAAPLTTRVCPYCGEALGTPATETVWVTELPPAPRPETRSYAVEVCRCGRCGRAVRGQHPEVAPDQWGATAHRLGPRALAAAHLLHYGIGVPVRRVPEILRLLGGLSVT